MFLRTRRKCARFETPQASPLSCSQRNVGTGIAAFVGVPPASGDVAVAVTAIPLIDVQLVSGCSASPVMLLTRRRGRCKARCIERRARNHP